MDEFDKFLQDQHPENETDVSGIITSVHVGIVMRSVEEMFKMAMGNLNQITISYTRVQPEGGYVWTTTVNGVTLMVDSFEELASAISRMV
jgi:hypothetical protein